jgi:hypothetical protein
MKLSERTVLASLHIGSWSGSSHDREVTEEVSEMHRADSKDSGRFTKQLISKKFLKEVNTAISLARRTHRLLTLPWDDDNRILATVVFTGYTEQMRLKRHGVEASAIRFRDNFPSYIHEAKTRLGSMFAAEDYPDAETVFKRFYVDVEIKPVPEAGDFRAELSDESTKAIVKDIERRTDERLQQAVNDVFQRVEIVTAKMVDRLRAYDPVKGENDFRDTLVYNVKDVADLLPSLNITNDPRLVTLQQRLLDDLVEHTPETLKDNERIRNKTADKAEQILKKVRSYIG